MLAFDYAPDPDGDADPGEVVWAWVPYEEDPSQGKDRPILIVARDLATGGLWGLPLTSKDHDRDAAQEASVGRYWMDIGTGGWDRSGRPSEVRLNRLVPLKPSAVRREGAAVSRSVFDAVIAAARPYLPAAPLVEVRASKPLTSPQARLRGLVRRLRGR
ncbi:type II toxin-antitoxin system PemK/MazF family toxin [Nocardioides sp. Kera G14]|uniref:type II toxin-antitoxin system PemK/MazF family toxin n=1 Tax=Nocardioides sp. Kera G14 TaxID=2884264 RepID=UPI001D0FD04D|nr:type II toxin-antitoxin system PemK/MazF family toxin [Nocardioides sp. Kera G14]UDY22463.1 type II toxin-antitoxin system PemK/MazF family toxin [Nocardioides sp. Kera G14]